MRSVPFSSCIPGANVVASGARVPFILGSIRMMLYPGRLSRMARGVVLARAGCPCSS